MGYGEQERQTSDGSTSDGISWGEASGNAKGRDFVQTREECMQDRYMTGKDVDRVKRRVERHTRHDDPAEGHGRDNHDEETFSMFFHVSTR